jgi:hypothetical protein
MDDLAEKSAAVQCSASLRLTHQLSRTGLLALLFGFLLTLYNNPATAKPAKSDRIVELIPATLATPNTEDWTGYLLLKLDVDNPSASLLFSPLAWKHEIYPPNQPVKRKGSRNYSVQLGGKNPGYYLLELPAGWYQITQVDAPYFNLPYQLHIENNPAWRFQVTGGAVNYAGHLTIAKERSSNYVKIRLHNRIATHLLEVEQVLSGLLQSMPLKYGGGMRDDFLDAYMEDIDVTQ